MFEEVTISVDDETINVDNSRSNTPSSATNDSYSNENSRSSLATTESNQTKFWTREEDLTPSAVLPDNLFTDEEMKSFNIDHPIDSSSISLNEDPNFSVTSLFTIKEEPIENEKPKTPDTTEETKKVTRRRIKAEPAGLITKDE